MVPLFRQLWRWVPDQDCPLHEGSRGQMDRGGEPVLPRHGPETVSHQAVQPTAVCQVGHDPLGAGESPDTPQRVRQLICLAAIFSSFLFLCWCSGLHILLPPDLFDWFDSSECKSRSSLFLSEVFLFQCHGQCVGPSLATQYRHVYCRDTNGTKVPSRMCGRLQR